MTPQELKNSILQLAIQGKLVEQRPEEGTAEELYRQIRAEKQKLIKEGRIKKDKPLSEIAEDEKPFDIPESWKWVRLCSIGLTQTGNTPKKVHPEYFGSFIPFLGPGDIQNGKVNYGNQGLSKDGTEFGRVANEGSVLQVCIGGSIGKCALVDRPVAFNQQINAITPIYSDSRYVLYLLWSEYFKRIIRQQSGGTATPIINRGIWDSIPIPFPPLAEQKRIVAKIEELLPLIDRYEKAWTRLEDFNKRFPADMQKSLLQMASQGKLVEQRPEEGTGEELYRQIQAEKQRLIKEGKIKKEKPLPEIADDEKPFDIPESWKMVRFGNIISLLSGTDFKPEDYNDQRKGTVYITGASNLSDTGVIVSRWTEKPSILATVGDVLLVCKGSGYGKTVICDVPKAHIARQIMAIKKYDFLCMEYIKYYLQASIQLIKSKGQGVIPGIDRITVLNMLLPLPPLAEQKRIVAKLNELLPLCEKLK